MTSHTFTELCSGRDCLFCGPLPSPEEQAWASMEAWHTDGMQMDHDMGLHDAGNGYGGAPNVNCRACFPLPRVPHQPLDPLDPDDDQPF